MDKPFQNHSHGYIFKTFKLESTQDLRIHKCTKNSLDLKKKLDTDWMKIVEIQIGSNPIHNITRI